MTARSARNTVLGQQLAWAGRNGKNVDARGYLASIDDNLFQPLSAAALKHFSAGSGGELAGTASRPAKMKALHSSSALAVNVFDYWTTRDTAPLARAFGMADTGDGGILGEIRFERQYPTGLGGNPPNLDVSLSFGPGFTIAIESKFTEWMVPKARRADAFRPAYFPDAGPLWGSLGLPCCQQLAGSVASGEEDFRWLDAPQLLKHALGLAAAHGRGFSLQYLYFDIPGREGNAHRDEIRRFSALAGPELRFAALSYQDLLGRISRHAGAADRAWLAWLDNRYFDGRGSAVPPQANS